MTPGAALSWVVVGCVGVALAVMTVIGLDRFGDWVTPDTPSDFDRCLAAGGSFEERDGADFECTLPGATR